MLDKKSSISWLYHIVFLFLLSGCDDGEKRGWLGEGRAPEAVQLTLRYSGSGVGSVTDDINGVRCEPACINYNINTLVTLTAVPEPNSVFTGWTDPACPGIGTCTVRMDADKTITAQFVPTFRLTILKDGVSQSSVSVTSDQPEVRCGTTCSASFKSGTEVKLTATPEVKFVFTGWVGAECPGMGSCSVIMNGHQTITAVFKKTFILDTPIVGSGMVTLDPVGINCGDHCATYTDGTGVTLTAVPAEGGVFASWDGYCKGTASSTCMITMDNDRLVIPQFSSVFAPAVHFSIDGTMKPYSVAISDLNADGHEDIVVAGLSSNAVAVLMGNGSTTLVGPPTFYPTMGQTTWAVAIGDFNADGGPDVATANEHSHDVSVLLANQAGALGSSANFAVGGDTRAIAVGDFNNDKHLDIVTANVTQGQIAVLLGEGTGSFGVAANFNVGRDPLAVTTGDMNKDGNADIIVANASDDTVTIVLRNGAGTFSNAGDFSVVGPMASTYPHSVFTIDLNRDGNIDIVTANRNGNTISVLLGVGVCQVGDCRFGDPINFSVGTSPAWVTAKDINNDGDVDLVIANSQSNNNVSVLIGDGTGSGFQPAINLNVGAGPKSIAISDINGDGKEDIVSANSISNNISILLGK